MASADQLEQLRRTALEELRGAGDAESLERWRIRYLGAKGEIKDAMRRLKDLPADARPAYGKLANEVRDELQSAYRQRLGALGSSRARAAVRADMTLPGEPVRLGHRHPVTRAIEELLDIFARMGFTVAYGPEVEDAWHSFDALNIPPAHVARDELNSFYVSEDAILRSHTSTVQIRVMEQQPPPVRIVAPGRVYRPDTVDATHSFMFHHIEGLYVDQGVTLADLKSCLNLFCKAYFGPEVVTRFRPSFFPFTEPSAEVDVPFHNPDGSTRWVELGGCGMVDPNVLQAVGYDSEKYTGYAFGMGIDRMIMRRHGIPDIRLLFENDIRFLRQF